MGETWPNLNPTRGVYSKSNEVEGRIRAFTPKPKEKVCATCKFRALCPAALCTTP